MRFSLLAFGVHSFLVLAFAILTLIFWAIIENAVEALADGGATKRLCLAVSSVNGSAALAVEDNGPGVPADALPRLFEPFFSLEEHGTGLGLAIARRTVEAHGGRIEASSGSGGTTFRVTLPLGGAP